MSTRAAIIGCGKRGRLHAAALAAIPDMQVAACADLERPLAEQLAAEYQAKAFVDVPTMLKHATPDFVAICTRPRIRLKPISQCASAGVGAIQCEKPMAVSWNEACELHAVCAQAGTQLTFTHQRRFRRDFTKARNLIREGAIGQVEQIEGRCPNLYDWGTHWFDMFFFLLGDIRATWVLGQADLSEPRQVFDAPVDTRGVSRVQFENGQEGVLLTSRCEPHQIGVRARGTEGIIEVLPSAEVPFRMLRVGGSGDWEDPPMDLPGTAVKHSDAIKASLVHAIECKRTGAEPLHGSAKALKATELIFATFASGQHRERVDLPLAADQELSLDAIFAHSR